MINRKFLIRNESPYKIEEINSYIKSVIINLFEEYGIYYVETILKLNNHDYKYLYLILTISNFTYNYFRKSLSKKIIIKLIDEEISKKFIFLPSRQYYKKRHGIRVSLIYSIEYNL